MALRVYASGETFEAQRAVANKQARGNGVRGLTLSGRFRLSLPYAFTTDLVMNKWVRV